MTINFLEELILICKKDPILATLTKDTMRSYSSNVSFSGNITRQNPQAEIIIG